MPSPAHPGAAVLVSAAVLALAALGCGSAVNSTPIVFSGDSAPVVVEGLVSCADRQPAHLELHPDEPLVVLVHGCFSSGGEFRSLSEVFEQRGQQTVCFEYDDRRTLRGTATRLRNALDQLDQRMPRQEVVVLGHSQGGLISHIALSNIAESGRAPEARYRLVTVSSPFSGIESSSHCGLTWLHIVSLGITVGLCQAIAGSKWTEIHPRSELWTAPTPLHASVYDHLAVVTDEVGTCRTRDDDGDCDEDDFVFSTAEQNNALILGDERVHHTTVAAGHVEIVGDIGNRPVKLIEVLQEASVLNATLPETP